MFALGIDFLTGVAVMTDSASRDKAEWPPHPARVFMALVAAHYDYMPLPEDGPQARASWDKEREALEWLEALGAPHMHWPDASPRDVVKSYVPVNDTNVRTNPANVRGDDLRAALGVLPDRRSRQERTFPSLYVGNEEPGRQIRLFWPNAEPPPAVLAALGELAGKVARIGHSSSLVQVWVTRAVNFAAPSYAPNAATVRPRQAVQLRIPSPGLLAELDRCFNAGDIELFFNLAKSIEHGTRQEKEQARTTFKERFGLPWSRTAAAPVRTRPSIGQTARYTLLAEGSGTASKSVFDSQLFVLTKQEGPVLGLESTAALTEALRGYLLKDCEGTPQWYTGHRSDGKPSTGGHLALLPLAYVGTEHADGHILGLALAFPSAISEHERAECLRGRLFGPSGEDLELELRLGPLGTWTLRREERALPPFALRAATWCEPSTVWASVTPIVLDRHPKSDPRIERRKWRDEVIAVIAQSCVNQGLPKPELIDVDKTSWHRGAPRSRPGPDGFPWLPVKEGMALRQQVHALIQFPCEIEGPLLLGAGRFRGYGVFKPIGYPPV
jgi:CRISPR-associated protein Csb2